MGAVLQMILLLLLLFLQHHNQVVGLRFDVTNRAPKCLSEYIHAKVIVLGNYRVISDDGQKHTISLKVSSPYGKALYNEEDLPLGEFGFTTTESGNYVACFWLPMNEKSLILNIELDWRTGVAAKDWDAVAKKEKIEGVELELVKLKGAVEVIHENLLHLKERERDMRNMNEHSNALVAWFGIASLLLCLLASGWQLWYLHRFFERKKLI